MKTFTASVIASAALLSLASAQEQYNIAPDSVSEDNRKFWCQQQITQCPLICLQPPSETATTNDNTCDADTLDYSCECGDGLRPNVTQYTQTLPFFICQEWGNQCVTGCAGDNACSSSCRQDHPCGAQDPIKPNSSTISSTMSSSASSSRTASEAGATTDSSGGTIYSGFGGASSTSDSNSAEESSSSGSDDSDAEAADSSAGRAAALEFGHSFGILALAGAFFGGFALVL